MTELVYRERLAQGDAARLLVLHHGRGADEHDLLPLADALDPQRRLHVVTPRAPLTLPGGPGYHWYLVPRVGYPDPDTFHAAYQALAGFHNQLWQRFRLDPERTVLGGFSMGSVMSYSLGLGPTGRHRQASSPSPASSPRSIAGSRRSRGAPLRSSRTVAPTRSWTSSSPKRRNACSKTPA